MGSVATPDNREQSEIVVTMQDLGGIFREKASPLETLLSLPLMSHILHC